jgi:hypothetical protein
MRHGILIEQYNDSDCSDVLTIPYDNSGPRMGMNRNGTNHIFFMYSRSTQPRYYTEEGNHTILHQ